MPNSRFALHSLALPNCSKVVEFKGLALTHSVSQDQAKTGYQAKYQ